MFAHIKYVLCVKIVASFIGRSACLTINHEITDSSPNTFNFNFSKFIGPKRGPFSLAGTIGWLLKWEVEYLINIFVLILTFSILGVCAQSSADRGGSVTYFLCLHHFDGPHYRMIFICTCEEMSGIHVCVNVDLWSDDCEARKSEGETQCPN